MGVTARAITVVSTAAVLVGACSSDIALRATRAQGSPPPINSLAAAAFASPSATSGPAGDSGHSAPDRSVPPPDAEGNPACPVWDSWGKAPTDNGVFVTYWSDGPDYVTVLVRTHTGADLAQSANIQPDQQLHLFDFPALDNAAVDEVLVNTNIKRCFATPDPATSGR
jgi:hypothetical protein